VSQQGFSPAPSAYGSYAAAPPSRPTTLTLAYFGALLTGLLSALGAALLLVQARDLAEQTARDATSALLGDSAGSAVASGLLSAAVDEATSTLVARGVTVLVSASLVIALALAIRNGALWARIVLAWLLLGSLGANAIVIADVAPDVTVLLGGLAMLLAVAVVVLLFLPPTNRYARARKLRTS
jgi:hypothetical protein